MQEYLSIDSITCESCVRKITDAIAPLKGINSASVELGTSRLKIDYDEAAWDEISSAIEDAGFDITAREAVG